MNSGKIITKIKKYKNFYYGPFEDYILYDSDIKMEVIPFSYSGQTLSHLILSGPSEKSRKELVNNPIKGGVSEYWIQINFDDLTPDSHGEFSISEPIINNYTENPEMTFTVKKIEEMKLFKSKSDWSALKIETWEKKIYVEEVENLLNEREGKNIPCFSPSIKVIKFRFAQRQVLDSSGIIPSYETNPQVSQFDNKLKLNEGEKISFNLDLINFEETPGEVIVSLNELTDLKTKGEAAGSLQSEIDAAKTAIEDCFKKNPPVSRDELGLNGAALLASLEGSHPSVDYIHSIRDTILGLIRAKRQEKKGGNGGDPTKNLAQLRQVAITAIENALVQVPAVDSSELTNPNWKNALNSETDETKITQLRDQLIAEINLKRSEKNAEKQILALIIQGQQQEDYSELAQTIQELKKFRSRSAAYQKHETEIDQLEAKLNTLDPQRYQAEIRDSLNQQIQDAGLLPEEVETEVQQAIEAAVSEPTKEKKKLAEEAISQNEANVGLRKILKQARSLKTKTEKQAMIVKILAYPNKNSFCQNSYQKLKEEVDKILLQLREERVEDNNNQNPSSFLKVFLPLVSIVGLGIGIISIILWKRKRKSV